MAASSPVGVTQSLQAWSQGERLAPENLAPLFYKGIPRSVHCYRSLENPSQTPQTSGLIIATFLRSVTSWPDWQNRAHFPAISFQLRRQVLVGLASIRHQWKRGGKVHRASPDEAAVGMGEAGTDLYI